MKAYLLPAGLAIVTLGVALVFIGVISAGLFYPGVYLIALGFVIVMVAGVLQVAWPERP